MGKKRVIEAVETWAVRRRVRRCVLRSERARVRPVNNGVGLLEGVDGVVEVGGEEEAMSSSRR